MDWKECKNLIYRDLKQIGGGNLWYRLLINSSFKITFWYRIGRYLLLNNHRFLLAFVKLIHRHHEIKYGIQVSFSNDIGGGLCFSHFSGIVIGCKKIGDNLSVFQGCTIGAVVGKGVPVLGNDVVMYAGAKIVGDVKIGNNVVVGANAVVVKDVPDNAVVVGVPAKIVSYNASKITKYFIK